MLKKIKNKNGSALTTAILIMIVVATIGIVTSLILSTNVRITLKRVNERMEIVRAENEMYEVLNAYNYEKEPNFESNGYDVKIEKETDDIYIFSISLDDEIIVKCKVTFKEVDGKCYYSIKSWSV